jgi:hypothetical protein
MTSSPSKGPLRVPWEAPTAVYVIHPPIIDKIKRERLEREFEDRRIPLYVPIPRYDPPPPKRDDEERTSQKQGPIEEAHAANCQTCVDSSG